MKEDLAFKWEKGSDYWCVRVGSLRATVCTWHPDHPFRIKGRGFEVESTGHMKKEESVRKCERILKRLMVKVG